MGRQPDLSHLTPEQRASYEAMHARMMSAFSYERTTISGDRALTEWDRMKAAGRIWPVIIGDDEALERLADQFSMEDPAVSGASFGEEPRAPDQIIRASADLHFPNDLSQWAGAYRDEDLRAPVGDWPDEAQQAGVELTVATDILTGVPFEQVHIVQFPTQAGWEVPAYLRWGNWNACPPPEYHVAALRSWHERYGAELVGINGDTMNLRVARRPQSREEALMLAHELYRYCPDIVDQGVETLAALGSILMSSDWWYFWWD